MNTVTIADGMLVIEPSGLDKLWGFRRRVVVPLARVRGATIDAGVAGEPKGIRAPGLHIPGKAVGTFHRDGEKTYWNVRSQRDNVVITFSRREGDFDRAVLTVADPAGTERLVNGAVDSER